MTRIKLSLLPQNPTLLCFSCSCILCVLNIILISVCVAYHPLAIQVLMQELPKETLQLSVRGRNNDARSRAAISWRALWPKVTRSWSKLVDGCVRISCFAGPQSLDLFSWLQGTLLSFSFFFPVFFAHVSLLNLLWWHGAFAQNRWHVTCTWIGTYEAFLEPPRSYYYFFAQPSTSEPHPP